MRRKKKPRVVVVLEMHTPEQRQKVVELLRKKKEIEWDKIAREKE